MKVPIKLFCFAISILATSYSSGQEIKSPNGTFSLGVRSTLSNFSHDGNGYGTGGQFRIQLNNRVNTDWFADYITINIDDEINSEYYHIGWSVLFYPFENQTYPKTLQPYILAGHCFDYNRKTSIQNPEITEDRWGSAIQGGIGVHVHLSEKLDLSITTQYMTHLTKTIELDLDMQEEEYEIPTEHRTLEGHLLSTLSVNYKIGKLWGK